MLLKQRLFWGLEWETFAGRLRQGQAVAGEQPASEQLCLVQPEVASLLTKGRDAVLHTINRRVDGVDGKLNQLLSTVNSMANGQFRLSFPGPVIAQFASPDHTALGPQVSFIVYYCVESYANHSTLLHRMSRLPRTQSSSRLPCPLTVQLLAHQLTPCLTPGLSQMFGGSGGRELLEDLLSGCLKRPGGTAGGPQLLSGQPSAGGSLFWMSCPR